ncbi:hypothetical protein D3C71_1568180 [compost metagenome]
MPAISLQTKKFSQYSSDRIFFFARACADHALDLGDSRIEGPLLVVVPAQHAVIDAVFAGRQVRSVLVVIADVVLEVVQCQALPSRAMHHSALDHERWMRR